MTEANSRSYSLIETCSIKKYYEQVSQVIWIIPNKNCLLMYHQEVQMFCAVI